MSCVGSLSRKSPPKSPPVTTESLNLDKHLCAYDDLAQHRTISPANLERNHPFRTYHQKYSTILSNRQNRNVAAEVAVVHRLADASSERVKSKLKLAEKVDPTRSGVGSNGGHIARKLGARGPLNGNSGVQLKKGNKYAQSELTKSIKYELDESKTKLIRNPEWAPNFVNSKTLEPEPLFKHPTSTQVGHHRRNNKRAIEVEVSKILAARGIINPLPDPHHAHHFMGHQRHGHSSHGSAHGSVQPTPRTSRGIPSTARIGLDASTSNSVTNGSTVMTMLQTDNLSYYESDANSDTNRPNTAKLPENIFEKTNDGSDKYDSIGMSLENRRLKKMGEESYKPKYIDDRGEFNISTGRAATAGNTARQSDFNSSRNTGHTTRRSGNNSPVQKASPKEFSEAVNLYFQQESMRPYTSDGTVATNHSLSSYSPSSISKYNPLEFISSNRSDFSSIPILNITTPQLEPQQQQQNQEQPMAEWNFNFTDLSEKLHVGDDFVPSDYSAPDSALIDRMDGTIVRLLSDATNIAKSFGLDDCSFLVTRLLRHSSQYYQKKPSDTYQQQPLFNAHLLPYLCYVGVLMGISPNVEDVLCLFDQESESVISFIQSVDPFVLPIRRVRRATQLKSKLISSAVTMPSPVLNAEVKLARWVNTFNIVADTIVAVYYIRKKQLEANMSVSAELHQTSVVQSTITPLSRPATSPTGSGGFPLIFSPARANTPAQYNINGLPSSRTNMNTERSGLVEDDIDPVEINKRIRRNFCVDLVHDQSCFEFWEIVFNTAVATARNTSESKENSAKEAAVPTSARATDLAPAVASDPAPNSARVHKMQEPSVATPRLPSASPRLPSIGVLATAASTARTPRDHGSVTATPRGAGSNAGTGSNPNKADPGTPKEVEFQQVDADQYEDEFEAEETEISSESAQQSQPRGSVVRAASMPHLRGKDQHFLHHHHHNQV